METYQFLVMLAAVLAGAVGWVMSYWWTRSEILKEAASRGYFVGCDGNVYKCLKGSVIAHPSESVVIDTSMLMPKEGQGWSNED